MIEKQLDNTGEKLDCNKKYLYEHSMFWECNDGCKCQILEDDVADLLNEQDRKIKELASKYSNRETSTTKVIDDILQNGFEIMNQRLSDYNAFLQSKITTLEQENEQLRQFNEDVIPKIKLLRTELFGEKYD